MQKHPTDDRMKLPSVLIVGRMPPPIGGVTTHVKRLTEHLSRRSVPFAFCDWRKERLLAILQMFARHRILHIHFSNPLIQMLCGILCRATRKKLITTYHGRWDRYGTFNRVLVRMSARLAYIPLVQEDDSYREALRCNRRAKCISTYIPSLEASPLPADLEAELQARRPHYAATFCTNAWHVAFDKDGKELYGISELVARFADYPSFQLLISDPSGNYRRYIQRCILHIPVNVCFISRLHDFQGVLALSDAFIRNTTTDGISLSIHEAQTLRIPVLASNAVPRPPFCARFDNFLATDVEAKWQEARQCIQVGTEERDVVGELIDVYRAAGFDDG